ncbi:hypothetical protein AB0D86_27205 [Streptomyces sp. NPDC048324]|uniref:hypothetical protein n=1 Tax=Streptomyces sp. NPDC048324 TaxID=3157205 RepID=UPI00341C18FE
MFLEASNFPVNPTREQLTTLSDALTGPRSTAAEIAAMLRAWKPGPAGSETM